MNCDGSEKWQIPCETKDRNMGKVKLLNVLSGTTVFFTCVEKKNRYLGAVEEIGVYDTIETKYNKSSLFH